MDLINSLAVFLPECILVLAAIFLSLTSSFSEKLSLIRIQVVITGFFLAAVPAILRIFRVINPAAGTNVISDGISSFSVILICLFFAAMLLFQKQSSTGTRQVSGSQLITVILFSIGLMTLTSTLNMIVLYLSVVLIDLNTFFLLSSDHGIANAKKKFVLFNIISQVLILAGFVILYAMSGSMNMPKVFQILSVQTYNQDSYLIAMLLVIAGFVSRLLVFPFHFSTAAIVNGFSLMNFGLNVVVLPTAFGISFLRFAFLIFNFKSSQFGRVTNANFDFGLMLIILSAVTAIIAAIMLFKQKNLYKVSFYAIMINSSLALLAVAGIKDNSAEVVLSQILNNFLMGLGFLYLLNVSGAKAVDQSDLFRSNEKDFIMIKIVLICMIISLAGVPPSFGFITRLLIYNQSISSLQSWNLAAQLVSASLLLVFVLKLFFYGSNDTNVQLEGEISISKGSKILLLIICLHAILGGLYFGIISKSIGIIAQM